MARTQICDRLAELGFVRELGEPAGSNSVIASAIGLGAHVRDAANNAFFRVRTIERAA